MTRKILINGRREEELRVAIVENQTLEDFEIETKRSGLLRNNIYRGVVSNIAPSLNAAFIDFGESRNGFLAFNDVVESAYAKPVKDAHKISDVLVPGQTLIVQVIKDAGGLKGAQVTTNISLAGRYLVLRPKDAKSGVSRKVDDDARADLAQKVRSLDLPDGYGCIVRTNAMDQSRAVLLRDAKVLVQLWRKIELEFAKGNAPQLLYNDQDIVVQAMRDYFDSSIHEVLIDDKSCYERAKAYIRATVESGENKIKYYDDKMPIFTRYGIERQIEQIYARTVALPSGGFIVIDPTEALTAIDVNSAHSTKRESQDLTAYHTNLEAAVEIGRQLRMRDIGGLIVIDFIDMRSGKHQRDVERVMRNAMARDKARNKVERISPNGLLEINRQRISQALSQRTHLQCPTCGGRGFIPSAEAMGLNLIREIDARAVNGGLGGVVIKLHPDIAQQLQNERRREFAQLEHDHGIRIEIVATREISRGEDEIEWLSKRQENALHPERTQQNTDAASIIDVAEAYEAHDSDDDVYRPNDYEEFSSEEARKKRAAKRAARKEATETKAEAEVEVKREESVSKREKREKREAEKREEMAKTEKRASKEGARSEKMHAIARAASSMVMLGLMLEQMRSRLEEDQPRHERGRRHFSIKARSKKGETKSQKDSGIRMDLRMFALDILKAVCVIACGCESNISRREMVSMVPAASDWLIESAQISKDELLKRVALLRTQIVSRHASARLTCLFDENHGLTPDELGRILISDRDAVVGRKNIQDEGVLEDLEARMASRCAQIFGEDAAPASFDTSAIEPSLDHLEEDDLQGMLATPETDDSVAEVKSETPVLLENSDNESDETVGGHRNRRRRNRRRSMDETPVEPYVGENCEIITSDVPIAPMTLIEGEETEEVVEESAISIAQAITQELPAVEVDRRNRRNRRRDRRQMEDQDTETPAPVQTQAEVAETPRDNGVELLHGTVQDILDKLDEDTVASQQHVASDDVAKTVGSGRRRERRKNRRSFEDAENVTAVNDVVEPVPEVQTLAVENVETRPESVKSQRAERPERRSERHRTERSERASENQVTSEPKVEKAPETRTELVDGENRSIRRVRKTRAVRINLEDYVVEALAETPAAPAVAIEAMNAAASVNVPMVETIIAPVESNLETVEETVHEPASEVRRERRTRRARRGTFDASDDVKVADTAVAEPAVAETAVAEPAVAETAVAETTVAEPAVAETAVAETAVAETTVAETTVAETTVAEPVVAEPAVTEVDETTVVKRKRRARRSSRRQSLTDIEDVAVNPVVESPVGEAARHVSDSKRRVRKTRRMETEPVIEAVAESTPVKSETVDVAVVEMVSESSSEVVEAPTKVEKRRVRKTRPAKKTDVVESVAEVAETAPVVETAEVTSANVVVESSSVEKRRVRKTRPRQLAASDLAENSAQPQDTVVASVDPEPVIKEKRSVRKTRRVKPENSENVTEPSASAEPVTPEEPAESSRGRVRRTRRSKLED